MNSALTIADGRRNRLPLLWWGRHSACQGLCVSLTLAVLLAVPAVFAQRGGPPVSASASVRLGAQEMPVYSPYSREKQHVLLSFNVAKSDMATGNRFCKATRRSILAAVQHILGDLDAGATPSARLKSK